VQTHRGFVADFRMDEPRRKIATDAQAKSLSATN
jgi:hypothetical protein